MIGYRCSSCGYLTVIRRSRCRKCGGREFREVDISRGKLVAVTTLYVTRPSYQAPLRIGLVELGEAYLIAQVPEETLEAGMEVRIEKDANNIVKVFRAD